MKTAENETMIIQKIDEYFSKSSEIREQADLRKFQLEQKIEPELKQINQLKAEADQLESLGNQLIKEYHYQKLETPNWLITNNPINLKAISSYQLKIKDQPEFIQFLQTHENTSQLIKTKVTHKLDQNAFKKELVNQHLLFDSRHHQAITLNGEIIPGLEINLKDKKPSLRAKTS